MQTPTTSPEPLQHKDVDHTTTDHMAQVEDQFGTSSKKNRNPLVLCAIGTAGVLVAGLVSFQQGDSRKSQMLMRTRVGFQAATVALMVGSAYYYQTARP